MKVWSEATNTSTAVTVQVSSICQFKQMWTGIGRTPEENYVHTDWTNSINFKSSLPLFPGTPSCFCVFHFLTIRETFLSTDCCFISPQPLTKFPPTVFVREQQTCQCPTSSIVRNYNFSACTSKDCTKRKDKCSEKGNECERTDEGHKWYLLLIHCTKCRLSGWIFLAAPLNTIILQQCWIRLKCNLLTVVVALTNIIENKMNIWKVYVLSGISDTALMWVDSPVWGRRSHLHACSYHRDARLWGAQR